MDIVKNKKLVCGIGLIGKGLYKSKFENKSKKDYIVWKGMINRCYNENSLLKHPSYKGCTVDERWHNFQVFAKWYEKNYVEGWQLDKDILFKGNKIYSPETCCFVPHEINSLFTNSSKVRGEYPLGVCKKNKKFEARLNKNQIRVSLGMFDTPEEAFQAYKIAKEVYIGHTATVTHLPENYLNLWNLDSGSGWHGKLTIMNIDTKEFWQSDFARELYPNEKGRG